MTEDLERRLSLDMVQDTLRSWLEVNEQATALYESMPPDRQEWAVTAGGGFEMLVPCLAVMKPEVREVAKSFILDALDTLAWVVGNQDRLSQAVAMVGNERSGPSDGAEMNENVRVQAEVDDLRQQVMRLRVTLLDHLRECPPREARPSAQRSPGATS